MNTVDRTSIVNQLTSGSHWVTFAKVDGTVRRMLCTLDAQHLPPLKESATSRASNPNVIQVWDMEKAAWRSFRVDCVHSISAS